MTYTEIMYSAALPRTSASKTWSLWSGAILPCFIRQLTTGDPYLVALCYRAHGHGRLIVRVQWNDGSIWVAKTFDVEPGILVDTDPALHAWADSQLRPLVRWWISASGKKEFTRTKAA